MGDRPAIHRLFPRCFFLNILRVFLKRLRILLEISPGPLWFSTLRYEPLFPAPLITPFSPEKLSGGEVRLAISLLSNRQGDNRSSHGRRDHKIRMYMSRRLSSLASNEELVVFL